ncbi:hypothetical protein COLO4_05602 [Corchorus olitorius]|uniref:Uncharacterized protein n=1 Tax=Corchorus olitorius TaxID=93759 RepID=A0A1R3KQF6_9ROSI|nr:hypothetical protein COLO4_05602 [Corchorus olitorius]
MDGTWERKRKTLNLSFVGEEGDVESGTRTCKKTEPH